MTSFSSNIYAFEYAFLRVEHQFEHEGDEREKGYQGAGLGEKMLIAFNAHECHQGLQ